jgi:hypothetical protein
MALLDLLSHPKKAEAQFAKALHEARKSDMLFQECLIHRIAAAAYRGSGSPLVASHLLAAEQTYAAMNEREVPPSVVALLRRT